MKDKNQMSLFGSDLIYAGLRRYMDSELANRSYVKSRDGTRVPVNLSVRLFAFDSFNYALSKNYEPRESREFISGYIESKFGKLASKTCSRYLEKLERR